MAERQTVLLAWEMGAGLGHAKRLLAVATELRAQGLDPVIAQRDIQALSGLFRESGIPIIPTPPITSLAPKNRPFRAFSYADIMAIAGYANAEALEVLLDAWDGLMRYLQPKVVIGDYCPILPMAVRGRVPFIAFGDGFVVPPHELPEFPPLRRTGKSFKKTTVITEDVNRLLRKRKQPMIDNLGQLVAGDAQVVCTLRELDIYDEHRQKKAAGPLNKLPTIRREPSEPRLFVYLAADFRHTRPVLNTILDAKITVEGYIRDAPLSLRKRLKARGMELHDEPPSLVDRLQESSAILHHGGIGTLEVALSMGCPQLLLPRHLEQGLNARNLKKINVVHLIDPKDESSIRRSIASFLDDRETQAASTSIAEQLATQDPAPCLEHLAQTVNSFLR